MNARTLLAALCLPISLHAESPPTLVIHGGAGVTRDSLSPEKEARAREVLEEALRAGHAVLTKKGSALEAVQTAIVILEDSPVFNAGRGAVLNADGIVELDASLMDGQTLAAGAVAGVHGVRNPIRLAHKVMTETPHVLLIGAGAEALAQSHKLRFEKPEWFVTPEQKKRLERAQKETGMNGGPGAANPTGFIGTVGAVALDTRGHLAAGTSTGGLVNKMPGRVGDSPIIGAGTYAEDGVCAVSCTGHGEFFIRNVVAHEVAARIKHGHASLDEAADGVVNKLLKSQNGRGGLISVDATGKVSTPFNAGGMYRAWMGADGVPHIAIFND